MPKNKEEDKDYKRLGEEDPRELTDPIFITNAGLIIIAPYLGMLFTKCGLMEDNKFINEESRFKAVQLLQYAATGTLAAQEIDLVLNKILCGMSIDSPIDLTQEITEEEKEFVDSMLTAITQHWSALRSSTIDSLRGSFLLRDGKLQEENETYYLKVEQKSFDMLLDQIPWNISIIKLSWMDKMLEVLWR